MGCFAGYWLLKFDGVSYSEHDGITEIPRGKGNIEYAYYKMALRAGIRKYAGIIDQVENAVACWNEIAKDCGVRENHREEISRALVGEMKRV